MEVINNKKEFRFETLLPDGEYITLGYRWLKGSMALMHTLVPASARGTGMGTVFVAEVLKQAAEKGLKVIPYCSFVAQYIKDHPEWNDLVDEAHRGK
jgi:predicted GNAT family acetyltransferase